MKKCIAGLLTRRESTVHKRQEARDTAATANTGVQGMLKEIIVHTGLSVRSVALWEPVFRHLPRYPVALISS